MPILFPHIKKFITYFALPFLVWCLFIKTLEVSLPSWEDYYIFEHSDAHLYTKQSIELLNPERFLSAKGKCGHQYGPGYPLYIAVIMNLCGLGDYQHIGVGHNTEMINQIKYTMIYSQSYIIGPIMLVVLFNFYLIFFKNRKVLSFISIILTFLLFYLYITFEPNYLKIVHPGYF